jgi:dolichol kinase
MALGDGLAPIFGSIRPGNRVLFGRRTLYGSVGLFIVCLLVIAVMSAVLSLPLAFWQMLVTALAAVGLELIGGKGLDNLTLPLGVFLLVFAFAL